jgi:hypothetical protein
VNFTLWHFTAVLIEWEARWVSEHVWAFSRREKSYTLAENLTTLDHTACNKVTTTASVYSSKVPLKNNIVVGHMHTRLTMNSILKNFIKKGDS